MPRRSRWAFVLGALLALALTGTAHAQGPTLRVGLPSLPTELDPATALEGSVPLIARQVFDTLVHYADGGSDIESGLALHWSVSRNNLTWTFHLRDGVRFHDGTLLTAQHVVDSLERQLSPGHPLAPASAAAGPRLLRGAPGVIKDLRALDARTVQINLMLPYAPLVTVLAHPAFSVVLPAGSGLPGARWQGTGPFAVTEIGAGRITLEARPTHRASGSRLGRMMFVEASDEAQGIAALDANQLDVLVPAGAPPRANGAVSIPGWRIGYLALQTEKEPLSRVKVRRAIAAALDPALLAPALGQVAVPLQSFLPPGVWSRRDAPPIMQGNPERARKLLAEAALPRVPAPGLLVADGRDRLDSSRVADTVRAALASAGVATTVQVHPLEAATQIVQSGGDAMAVWEARVEGGDPHFLLYALSTSEGATKGPNASNLSFYRNPKLDDLLIRSSQLSFRPERQRLYVRAQSMLADELPWIPLYVRLHWVVARPEVRNLRLHPSGFHRLERVVLDTPVTLPPATPILPSR